MINLLQWERQGFGHIRNRIHRLEEGIQQMRKGCLTAAAKTRMEELKTELEENLAREEMTWKQRSKAEWLREGDKNTAFFHARASERRKNNTIRTLKTETSSLTSDRRIIKEVILRYFQQIFRSICPDLSEMEGVIAIVSPRVTEEMNEALLQPFSLEEVKCALDHMYPYKSPGTDGMSPVFYQKFWHIIGLDVSGCVFSFLNNYDIYTHFNSTHIVFIPKCENPVSVTDFRSISLCNVTYKLASKNIANRIKPRLNDMISESQFEFVPDRLITDNVLVAFELNHFLAHERWGSVRHIALKLDINKAYDRVEWRLPAVWFKRKNKREVSKEWQYVVAPLGQLGVELVDKHEKYLGLPTMCGRSKRELFSNLKSRVWSKMQSWGAKRLSQAGRMVLIKAVAQAIPTQHIHWLSWKKLCKNKDEGGVGFYNLKAFILAMLAKQAWQLVTVPDSLLSGIIKAKHYPDSDFLEARCRGQLSYAWRSIVASRELISKGIRWRVGDGKRINIASDPWLPRLVPYKLIIPPMTLAGSTTVNELLYDDGRCWNEELIEAEFREEDAACIKSIEL
ncbi:UNVERIFIED_CONTAM: putative mitochondrial protein [Sesamum radiatum]|uniref:Mitochondrial protein n=1 Tax=Sesamum radiatum TaxID=300843 RepID=A0AAW2NPV8_SESRA